MRERARRRLRACAGALAAVVAVLLPAVLLAGPGTVAVSPEAVVTAAGTAAAGDPVPDAELQLAAAAPPALRTPADVVAAMLPAGTPRPDPVSRPPGSIAVSRTGEDGLELSWALLDTGTGAWTGSADAAGRRTEAESTIKAWLAADLLRTAAAEGRPVSDAERADIEVSVRASDNPAAQRLYRRLGQDASVARLEPECGVAVSPSRPGWWSFTQLTALDAARMLACVRDRAPEWPGGELLLEDLRSITPDGRSGIAATLPGPVWEKNGWTRHGAGYWNVNCVLAWDDRALAVLTTYPAGRDVDYGWGVCRDVAADVVALG